MMKTEQKNFRILYTSDIHGRLFAEAGEAGLDETGRGFCKDGNTLIFDGGDLLQGGPAGTFFVRETKAGNGGRNHPAAVSGTVTEFPTNSHEKSKENSCIL